MWKDGYLCLEFLIFESDLVIEVLNFIIFLIDGILKLPDVEFLDLSVAMLRPPQILNLRNGLTLILILQSMHLQLLEIVSLSSLILQPSDLHNIHLTSVSNF